MPLGDMFGQSFAAVNGGKPAKSDRIQPGQPLNMRGAFEAAQNIPVAGDAISGVMAAYDAAKGDYPSAAMNALGVLPFVTAGTVKGVGKAADALSGKKLTEFEQRHLIAQKNAALPVEQGGLGLPLNNTAMDRARAMGFEDGWLHGTRRQFNEFAPSSPRGANGNKKGVYFTKDKQVAEEYAQDVDGAFDEKSNVIGAMLRNPEVINHSYRGAEGFVENPANIRSRFAAFDPMRRHEADLLGNINPQLAGAMGVTGLGAAYGATQLPDEYKSAIANAFSGR